MSVRPSAWNNSAPTGRVLLKFYVWLVFRKIVMKIQVSLKSEKKRAFCYIQTHAAVGTSYIHRFESTTKNSEAWNVIWLS
jgi:RNase P subunit RPR2